MRRVVGTALMSSLVLVGLAASSAVAVPQAAGDDQGTRSVRIVDGVASTVDPGIVAVLWAYKKNGVPTQKAFCTGTVVAPQWIMTAHHCMGEQQLSNIERVSFRVNSLKALEGGQEIKPEKWEFRHDIALVKLKEPIVDPKIVKLADADPPEKSTNTIYGFGTYAHADMDNTSLYLKQADVTVQDSKSTDYFRGPAIISYAQTGSSSHGDSGGPQFYQGTQVGVSSMAARGIQMYSSVAQSKQWIAEILAKG